MENPVLVEVTRGGRVESAHRGAFALVDSDGHVVASAGDVTRPVYPRSAVKVFQALPLLETGAAAVYGLQPAELALACASHSGEPAHVKGVDAMLGHGGLSCEALECGSHWPFDPKVAKGMVERGERPTPLHNNCSGKHAGFLLTALHRGEPLEGYVKPNHPVQVRVREAISDLVGESLNEDRRGIDGCSIPTYAAPLRGLAEGFAKLVTGRGVSTQRREAGRSLIEACMAHPFEMSGTGRFCKKLMETAPGRVFAKTGAEGVFCGAIPELGLGFALKIDDGATRASEALCASVIAEAFAPHDTLTVGAFAAVAESALTNWRGIEMGRIIARTTA